ncbi:MAG: hypothetical protein E6I52_24290 [Chloroflexi bacterium]|nr:MAG: hypothetical protein E6I52_24290 [Chloroflexota bacterium]
MRLSVWGVLLAIASLLGTGVAQAQVAAGPSLTTSASPGMAAAGTAVTITVAAAQALSAPPTVTVGGTCVASSAVSMAFQGFAPVYAGSYVVPGGTGDCAASISVSGTGTAGNALVDTTASIGVDRTPPGPTSATISGATLSASGWYTTSPSISLASTDATSGVAATYYQLVPHLASAPTSALPGAWTAYSTAFSPPDGDADLYAFSVDKAGNVESPVNLRELKVDTVAPRLTTTISQASAAAGANVTLLISSSDPLPAAPSATSYTGTYTVPAGTTDCPASVAVTGTDLAGNASTGGSASFGIARAMQTQKIDPALLQQMAANPGATLPVIVEMGHAATPFPAQPNVQLAQRAVGLLQQHGTPVAALPLIDAAAGWASATQIQAISLDPGVVFVHEDSTVTPRQAATTTTTTTTTTTATTTAAISATQLASAYPRAVRADSVWAQGGSGSGVTVAVLDSGIAPDADLTQPSNRILAAVNFADPLNPQSPDPGGHGTHVAGVIAGNGNRSAGQFIGIAPSANLVDVRVLDSNGNGRISSLIRGIDWVLAHSAQYHIRVINLSVGAPARLAYRADPLAAAVEIAWDRGLVVVTAAGNNGAAPGAIDRPGNDPYVVTVGATDDQGTAQVTDDTAATFSSQGTPTGSTLKPEVVAPGRRIVSIRVPGSALDTLNPTRVVTAANGSTYLRMSGTSASAAVVSGSVALLLERQPSLSPNQVKAILTGTTQTYGAGLTHGLIDAFASVTSPSRGFANQGLHPADAFSRTLYPILYGQPLISSDPRFQGIIWDSVIWDGIIWDGIIWDGIIWDGIIWDSLPWSTLGWDTTPWDNAAWNRPGWDSSAWGTLPPD